MKLAIGTATDCYQPIERRMKITRQLLEICLEYRNPVGIHTKNALVLRDLEGFSSAEVAAIGPGLLVLQVRTRKPSG